MDEETKREIASLKQYFEMVIANNEARRAQTEEAQREALHVALHNNDKRLDGMNEFRAALTDQTARTVSRAEYDALKEMWLDKSEQAKLSQDNRFESEFRPLLARIEQFGKPNWALMISAASIFFVMITGVWLVIGLKIDATVTPLSLGLAQVHGDIASNATLLHGQSEATAASTQADIASRSDRSQLNERIRVVESSLATRSAERNVLVAKLTEIETQFCASDLVRNLMHANDLRLFSMLWHRSFPDTILPTDNAYYPQICNSSMVR